MNRGILYYLSPSTVHIGFASNEARLVTANEIRCSISIDGSLLECCILLTNGTEERSIIPVINLNHLTVAPREE